MKNLIFTIVLFGSYLATAQTSLNSYKYIIVPKKFEGFRNQNQYLTSTMIKYLFTQKGFNTVYDDALPTDLNSDRCLGLIAILQDDSSTFVTKTSIQLKDCHGVDVMTTQQGKSKLKDYKESYKEAITEAFESVPIMNYTAAPKKEQEEPITVSFKNDVKSLDETKVKAKNKPDETVVKQEATTDRQSYKSYEPTASDIKKVDAGVKIAEASAIPEKQSNQCEVPIIETENSPTGKAISIVSKAAQGVLYAQELPNGYQLVDSAPQIRIKIFSTSLPDYYLAESEDSNGVVYTKGGLWFFEYYQEGQLVVEELNIKF